MLQVMWRRKVLTSVIVIALLTRFSQRFRRAVILMLLKTELGCKFALYTVRAFLGHIFPPVLVHWWFPTPGHVSHDYCQVLHNLDYSRRIRYGPHPREELDALVPLDGEMKQEIEPLHFDSILMFGLAMGRSLVRHALFGVPEPNHPREDHHKPLHDAPAILFGHGGGAVCQGSDVQLQQITPISRQGFSMFAFNYPLAPEDRFPAAVISCLRALSWLKTEKKRDKVALLGESAGGTLITYSAALLSNRDLLKELAQEVDEPIDQWDYPELTCVVSWYSILCSEHWKGADWLSIGLEKVMEMYKSESNVFQNRLTLLDLKDRITHYPPTLLIAGETDPLGLTESSKAAHEMLQSKNLVSELAVYKDQTHGFIGYPVQMQIVFCGGDKTHVEQGAIHAINRTINFLKTHHSSSSTNC